MNDITNKPLVVETASLPWIELADGVQGKAVDIALDDFGTRIVRLAPGACLPPVEEGLGLEVIVLKGELQFGSSLLGVGGFARRPAKHMETPSTKDGCTLYVKTGPFAAGDTNSVTLQAEELPWSPGHGNLRVKSLHNFQGLGSALVHWPAGERFLLHQHFGGEEIFVLSGTFEDEHGRYPEGTWVQSPHLSQHHPFVLEETVIFVKTGHLPVPS